ncbi:MAG: anhydro-N-acetylmuramic acid kinase [Alphaproteobacteria bacterium]|nr:anhydro-N-acetylmuramic acid kinase [Alphaproteobacteria bacterium]
MKNGGRFRALGLMSGTSMDGVDAALIETDGVRVLAHGAARTDAYESAFRAALRAHVGREPGPQTAALERELTERHAESVRRLLAEAGLAAGDVDVIGFHGHTVLHDPKRRITRQIGDGRLLAALTGIPVVNDFRSRDVAQGGEGAPLAPLYHAAQAADLEKPLAVLNIGGVANVTWLGEAGPGEKDRVIAFDTGPGNALLDDWAGRTLGRPMDEDGGLARAGRADERALAQLLDDAYFRRPPPKSLDRDHFARIAFAAAANLSPADGAATLAHFTAESVARARAHFPAPPRRWLVCGGGRRNGYLMAKLAAVLDADVRPVEAVGWRGDALEAEAFAFLAVRSLKDLPLSLPSTTGVAAPCAGGVLHKP